MMYVITGAIDLTVSGGTTPYTYLWSNNETTEDLSALASGNYSVVVTDSNGCNTNSSATLSQPDAIFVSGSVTNVLCNGSSTGEIAVTTSGGSGNYSYDWGNGIVDQNRTNLTAGNYTITVTDSNNCSSSATSFVIKEAPSLAISSNKKNISCKSLSNGSISLSVSGGTYPYSYSWTGSNGYTETTQNIDNIPAGTYAITVTDSNSCSVSENGIELTQPAAVVSVVATPTTVTCQGGSNGSISAVASGGVTPYSYSWSTGATTATTTGLSKGPYTILVTDANGCTVTENVDITEPSTKLELYSNVRQSSACGNATGAIELSVVNGNAPFSYSWSNTSQTIANPTGLTAGTYTATVTDTSGCSSTLAVTVATAPTLAASITTYPKTCLYNDGSAYAIVTGGVGPYTYLWNNNATSQNVGLLGSGAVSVTITDSNGCTTTSSGTVSSLTCIAPIAVNDVFATNYQTTITGTVSTGDSDPDTLDPDHLNLQYFSNQNPTADQGVLNWGTDYDGSFTFIPAAGFSGTFTLTYKVFDPTGLSATGTYTITVGPNAVNDAYGTPLDTELSDNVNTNDVFPTNSVFSKLTDPAHGTVTFNSNGTFTYTPTTNYAGDDSFTYKICLGSPNETICSSTSTVLISVDGSADVAIAKTISNSTPDVGSDVVFTLTATNNGPNLAVGVNVTDALPTGYTYVSNATATGSFDASTGIWTLGSLVNSASASLQLTAKVNPSGDYTNTVSVSADSVDPDSSNNSASISATPVLQSDISITGSVDNASQNTGSSVTFSLTVMNDGPNDATSVSLTDLLPSGFTYSSSSPSVGNYDSSTGVWSIGDLSNGSSETITITATVNSSGNYTNSAIVSSTTNDSNSVNNTVSQTITPGAISNLSITKTINNAHPYVGGLVEFTLTARNYGPNNATNVSVLDQLPSGYTYDSDNGITAYNSTTGIWSIGNLNNGSTKVLKVYAYVRPTGDYTNSASISSTDQPDSDNSNNNSNAAPTSVIPQADLSILKTVDSNEAVIGNNVQFTISVTNNGPSSASGVSVTDLLPSGYTFVSSNTSVGSYNSSTGLWTIGAVSNGTTKTIVITATVNNTGNYINVASVSSTSTDLVSENNSSSKTVTPIPELIVNNPSAVCYPGTIDITSASITAGSSSNLTLSYWNDSNTTSPFNTPTEATNGTYYIKATTSTGNFTVSPVFVTVDQISDAGTISGAASVCTGTNSSILTLSDFNGSIQWQSSNALSGTYSNITNATSSTYTATNINSNTYYRAIVTNGSCSNATSSSVLISVLSSKVWSGSVSTEWNNASNWNCGVPSSGDNIEIPAALTNYPILDSSRTIGNLTLDSGATIDLNNSSLTISGTISGTGTLIGSTSSSINIAGSGNQGTLYMNQTTPGTTNILNNFTLNSISSGRATLGNALGILGTLTLTNGTFYTGGNLTLMSNASSTAVVAPISDCNAVAINGDVTVERYYPAKRAFRFISSPVTTTTSIRSNWQEGVNNPPPAYVTNLNPNPGYGTHITGTIIGSNGFDITQTTNNSLFTYNNTSGAWVAATNTNSTTLSAGFPYRLLIRGDRSINMSTNTPTATNTTLRAKGELKICDASAGTLNQTVNGFSFIGNPYQAVVDIKSVLSQYNNFNTNFYWVWDPQINVRGGYVAYDLSSNINPIESSLVTNLLQPWQACFVKNNSNGGGSITFKESYKSTSVVNENVYKSSPTSYLRLTLYESNTLASNGVPADGLVIKFGSNYNNDVDSDDAIKLVNQDEIFASKNNTSLLGIESRFNPNITDVIPLNLTQYRFNNYTIVAQGNNMNGITSYLHDRFLNTYVEIPQSNFVNYSYSINPTIAATSAQDRFRIVFQNSNLNLNSSSSINFSIYPNPSKQGVFDIAMENATKDTYLTIYNTVGQVVYTTNLKDLSVNHINPNKVITSGVYYVKIKKDGATTIKKLVIE